MQQAKKILREVFGYQEFRLHQEEIISALASGKDVFALMPTGGGKSLCYQLPALLREGVGVVISPLIALMQDQVEALKILGVKAAYLNSTLSHQQINLLEADLRNGKIDLLYIAPERLLKSKTIDFLSSIQVSLFAIDEAHCVSQWGHDFRPEYQQLSMLANHFPEVPRIALTATADQRTREEIIQQLGLSSARQFVNSFDRPNIRYTISEANQSRESLWRFIETSHPNDAGIVYCLSRRKVESVADWLSKKGRVALPYHAGLTSEARSANQQRFLREEGIIIVATIAFGMGIDKPDVRFVAHLSLPKSLEAYYQETGRAGRDGQAANAWMAYGLNDVISLKHMLQQSEAADSFKQISQQKLESMLGLCELTTCRRISILSYFGETYQQPCGNCDNCLSPPKGWNASVEAQKALSCVYRTGQRFGSGYVIDVLRGKEDQRIIDNQHHQLSTFGVGSELSVAQWRSLLRQLIARGFLSSNYDRFGALSLTEKCRPLLKGEAEFFAREMVEKAKSTKKATPSIASIHQSLFDSLKKQRSEIADSLGVPAYMIFHDSTLIEMAERRPDSLQQMQYISGVGSRKLEQYGKEFLMIIQNNPLPDLVNADFSDTVNETMALVSEEMTVREIARQRELTESTIYGHIAVAIEEGIVDPMDILEISEEDYQLIVQSLSLFESKGSFKQVFESLGETFDYGVIRCVAAAESYGQ
ncbi:DNA helicase RecQ [Aliikangiella marina]|uniref:DNA helicase RecQ n=1 Tax=Aliikangiella marina TaxID=1712262 RepID=A0A545T725_9GAMM|nr:DNA helicase RecQ [Aliikangiella marina]TQV73027.1 DNA helicase RecQ [Aliikangiella marina]